MPKKHQYTIDDLSPHLFWDVDRSQLSFSKSAVYLIERIAFLGDLSDWQLLRGVYGDKRLKEVLLNVRFMDDKSLHFYSLIFDIPKEQFRCYKLKQLNLTHSPF